MDKIYCEHIETGGIGIIKDELKGTKDFPDQFGIFWIKKANCHKYPNHYYWNDKSKIKIINQNDLPRSTAPTTSRAIRTQVC